MEGYGPATYGDGFADVYDDWFGAVSDVEATVESLGSLAGRPPGTALELGAGTGRLALPLAARGVPVVAVDASGAMLARLRTKSGGDAVPVVVADMAALPFRAGAGFALVFVAFNTLFNLGTTAAQGRCLADAARVLAPDGKLVVEAFVPAEDARSTSSIEVRTVAVDRVVLAVSRHDPADQTVSGQHVEITEHGGVRLRPWHLRYTRPAELDSLAEAAGLCLLSRHGGWAGEPFDAASAVHVSVYERAEPT